MEDLKIFENSEFGTIRTVTIEGEPWFAGKDVAAALGYKDTKNALKSHVDSEDKRGWQITTPSGKQIMTIINESGVYSLIMSSKLPAAKRFKRWVTSEVLPAIRKKGAYGGAEGNLLEITGQLAHAASMVAQVATSMMQSADRLTNAVLRISDEGVRAWGNPGCRLEADIESLAGYDFRNSSKIDNFPPEITAQVNRMLEEMVQQQSFNFSMIARYCTLCGYPVSQPTVKRYFQKQSGGCREI